jgi:hypothetical protein
VKHIRPIIAILSLTALAGGTAQARTSFDATAVRIDYQAMIKYEPTDRADVPELLTGPDGCSAVSLSPAQFHLPSFIVLDEVLPLTDFHSTATARYLLYGALLFYDCIAFFA